MKLRVVCKFEKDFITSTTASLEDIVEEIEITGWLIAANAAIPASEIEYLETEPETVDEFLEQILKPEEVDDHEGGSEHE